MPPALLGSSAARQVRLFVVALLVLGAQACESATEAPVAIPEGVAVTLNGTVVARAMDGVSEGEVHVHLGEYSGVFVVSVLNGRGDLMPLEADHYLEAAVEDFALATFVQPFSGAFRGEIEMFGEEGHSTLVFRLMRTGSSVPEWTSPPIAFVVSGC